MKKYTKPYLLVESFQLDAAIAAGSCSEKAGQDGKGGIAINYGVNSCVYKDDGGDLWFGNNCGAAGNVMDQTPGDFCYQIMTVDVSSWFIGS